MLPPWRNECACECVKCDCRMTGSLESCSAWMSMPSLRNSSCSQPCWMAMPNGVGAGQRVYQRRLTGVFSVDWVMAHPGKVGLERRRQRFAPWLLGVAVQLLILESRDDCAYEAFVVNI